ncbi:MAG: polymer-forming cytoskeletal protein [Treponema sp.]|nr:polymer-forming cytoskeletal protein [Treponema sp.]MCL2251825.1 polymer-forming cytoskeletal protein [Treponema sp.]
MPKRDGRKKDKNEIVVLGKTTSFTGILKFETTLRIQGIFRGTIEAVGDLIVDKDAIVEADHITVSSLTVFGSISGTVHAHNKVDMMTGAKVHGDVTANRLRIADGVLFEGKCKMTNIDKDIEIFHRPTEEIKADLQRSNVRM